MARKRNTTSDAVEIMQRRYFEGRPERQAELEEERANAEVARKIYDLRQEAGLTQQELARLIGTTASVISRLEDADYEGHSLSMLRRIAGALQKRVEIRFVSVGKRQASQRRALPDGKVGRRKPAGS
ncbi:MAG: XRE family transcriptional regulator [Gemmatimonadetes bacterium]|nr:XRE family transcriptional regulator [Gemmatimonadota bacterium]